MEPKNYEPHNLFCHTCETYLSICTCDDWYYKLKFLFDEGLIDHVTYWKVVIPQIINRQKIKVENN